MDRFLRLTGFVLLLQLVPCGRLPVVRAQLSGEVEAPSLGLTLGTLPVAKAGWDRIERTPRWATWLYLPMRGPVGWLTEIAWGRWQVNQTSGGYDRAYTQEDDPYQIALSDILGDELTLLAGPVIHVGNLGPADLWLGASAGLDRHREWARTSLWRYDDSISTIRGGRHEIRAVIELRLRLGGARYNSLPTIEIAHRWSRSQWMLREEPALVGSGETRLALSIGLISSPRH